MTEFGTSAYMEEGGGSGEGKKKYGDTISQLFILIQDPRYLGFETGDQ